MPTLVDLTDDMRRLHDTLTAVGQMDLSDEDRAECEDLLTAQMEAVGDGLGDKEAMFRLGSRPFVLQAGTSVP